MAGTVRLDRAAPRLTGASSVPHDIKVAWGARLHRSRVTVARGAVASQFNSQRVPASAHVDRVAEEQPPAGWQATQGELHARCNGHVRAERLARVSALALGVDTCSVGGSDVRKLTDWRQCDVVEKGERVRVRVAGIRRATDMVGARKRRQIPMRAKVIVARAGARARRGCRCCGLHRWGAAAAKRNRGGRGDHGKQ